MTTNGNLSRKFKAGTISPILPQEDITAHIKDKANPHQVTKEQLGLSNVTNVTQAEKQALDAHISGIGHIQQGERSYWNSKAEGIHKHTAADIEGVIGTQSGGISVKGMPLYANTFVDISEDKAYLRTDGSGDYLLHVTFEGIPYLREVI